MRSSWIMQLTKQYEVTSACQFVGEERLQITVLLSLDRASWLFVWTEMKDPLNFKDAQSKVKQSWQQISA